MIEDTIVAQATPNGKSGISIVRISGKKSLDIARQIFLRFKDVSNIQPNYMYLGKINLGDVEDKGFCVYFKAPNSFTGEDVVEFQCHGGLVVAQKIIEQVLSCGGRLATAGEFSKRAFLNGKMSLDQAEGVVDTINAETENQLKASNELTNGNLFKLVTSFQEKLTDILSEIEVNLDYPEHDIEYETKESIKNRLQNLLVQVEELLQTEQKGKLINKGISIAIVGKTNVGKSSLLNALLNYEQAIVTDIEGTTRDVVSGSIEYKGFIFNFYDTAGIRETEDKIESIGIEKAKKILENSDIVLLVLDSSRDLTKQDKENLELIKNKKSIVVLNKSDLPAKFVYNGESIKISAKQKINTEELKQKIYDLSLDGLNSGSQIVLTNARHIEVLKQAKQIIVNTIESISDLPLDCSALDIKTIWEKLGEITGNTATEDIIDKIFSKFCLGK
ncbi:MAG: tRNA uridine-5-carboxymethylaminomethyl(34) synthesis GTPase MnmE [Clostridia bacterium]|nr:tRNA uridine-5-carboxymethylaminomethyl(34) synthesis GTPase MnmE [Clostridia bacterium]